MTATHHERRGFICTKPLFCFVMRVIRMVFTSFFFFFLRYTARSGLLYFKSTFFFVSVPACIPRGVCTNFHFFSPFTLFFSLDFFFLYFETRQTSVGKQIFFSLSLSFLPSSGSCTKMMIESRSFFRNSPQMENVHILEWSFY